VHSAGLETLQCADGGAVVAAVGIKVILDGDRVGVRPGDECGAPLTAEQGAGRVLVGGGNHDGVGSGALQPVDARAGLVDVEWDRLESGARDIMLGTAGKDDSRPPPIGMCHVGDVANRLRSASAALE
jgi:hypothetical protein